MNEQTSKNAVRGTSRRTFLARTGLAATVGVVGAGGLSSLGAAMAAASRPTPGDIAILRFLSAAEIIETDMWQQYNELGGIQDSELPKGGGSTPYLNALGQLDSDMAQYVHDNTEDEVSHFTFINAYLVAKGANPVNFDKFRTLQGSMATGARHVGRLTNLTKLTVDTTWWTRYRSRTGNPDLGDTFPQAVPDLAKGQFPGIPRDDGDLTPMNHIQAIANTAGFHFAQIEQGGTSLYPSLAQRVNDREVLRILLSIGPSETMHFQTWQDKAGNAPAITDPTNGLTFPDLNSPPFGGEDFQTNLIMPEPTAFLSRKFPPCAVIRPTETEGAAMGALHALTGMGIFIGQSAEFLGVLHGLAEAADAARREF